MILGHAPCLLRQRLLPLLSTLDLLRILGLLPYLLVPLPLAPILRAEGLTPECPLTIVIIIILTLRIENILLWIEAWSQL